MQIAQVMAGYSLGGADLLRRAMGKKIAEEMASRTSQIRERARKKTACQPRKRRKFSTFWKSSPTTVSTNPRGRLCGGQLSNGVAQSQPPGRIYGRRDELRYPSYGQAGGLF